MAHEGEALTRTSRLDPKVKASGWTIVPPTTLDKAKSLRASAVRELPTLAGPADYALCDRGSVVGVIEAKKVGLGPQEVLNQAERYSRGIPQSPRYQGEYGVPFVYSSNGEIHWFRALRHLLNRSRTESRFLSTAAIAALLTRAFVSELATLWAFRFN